MLEQATTKTCSKCGAHRPVDWFRPGKRPCRACLSAQTLEWQRRNIDRVHTRRAEDRSANPERYKQISARDRARRADKIKEYHEHRRENAAPRVDVPDLPGEEWRDVAGYEGWYLVSNMGRVKRSHRGAGTRRGHILRAPLNTGSYPQVFLSLGTRATRRVFRVHRLVARAFLPPDPERAQINHIDGDKLNACASNIEWVTASENIHHAMSSGLR